MSKTIIQGLRETLPADIYELAMKYADPKHKAHKRNWDEDETNYPIDKGFHWDDTDEGYYFWGLITNGKYQEARELLQQQKAEAQQAEPEPAPDLFQTVKAAVKEALAERDAEHEKRMAEMWKKMSESAICMDAPVSEAAPQPDTTAPRLLTEEEVKRVKVTHFQTEKRGWVGEDSFLANSKIYYLGKDFTYGDKEFTYGDIFMERKAGYIFIYKGHLNPQSK